MSTLAYLCYITQTYTECALCLGGQAEQTCEWDHGTPGPCRTAVISVRVINPLNPTPQIITLCHTSLTYHFQFLKFWLSGAQG